MAYCDPLPTSFKRHGGGDSGGVEVHVDARIQKSLASSRKVVTFTLNEGVGPDPLAGKECSAADPSVGPSRPERHRPDRGRVGEDLLHPCVGLETPAPS